MNTTLQQIDRGLSVDQASRDRAISSRVMRSAPRLPDISDRILVQGDENDSPQSFGRALKASRKLAAGQLMAIHI